MNSRMDNILSLLGSVQQQPGSSLSLSRLLKGNRERRIGRHLSASMRELLQWLSDICHTYAADLQGERLRLREWTEGGVGGRSLVVTLVDLVGLLPVPTPGIRCRALPDSSVARTASVTRRLAEMKTVHAEEDRNQYGDWNRTELEKALRQLSIKNKYLARQVGDTEGLRQRVQTLERENSQLVEQVKSAAAEVNRLAVENYRHQSEVTTLRIRLEWAHRQVQEVQAKDGGG